ncbi:MAG: hypothetical protein ABIR58_02490 [Gemmatimonadaceae bacterium]
MAIDFACLVTRAAALGAFRRAGALRRGAADLRALDPFFAGLRFAIAGPRLLVAFLAGLRLAVLFLAALRLTALFLAGALFLAAPFLADERRFDVDLRAGAFRAAALRAVVFPFLLPLLEPRDDFLAAAIFKLR